MSSSKWIVDAAHSSVDFTIRHMMIAKVKGTFDISTLSLMRTLLI